MPNGEIIYRDSASFNFDDLKELKLSIRRVIDERSNNYCYQNNAQ